MTMTKTMTKSLLVVTLLTLGLAACGGDDDDGADTGQFRATWMITQPNGQATTCATAGIQDVSFLFTDSNQMGYDELFTCTDMTALTGPMPADTFTFVATGLDANGQAVTGIAPVSNTASLTSCVGQTDCIVPLPAVNLHMQ